MVIIRALLPLLVLVVGWFVSRSALRLARPATDKAFEPGFGRRWARVRLLGITVTGVVLEMYFLLRLV